MTTTSKTFKSRGIAYTVTATPTITPDGRKGSRITCDCGSNHPGAAIVATETPDMKTIHGNIVAAYGPLARGLRNVWAA